MSLVAQAISAIEAGKVPDSVVRLGIRRLLRERVELIAEQTCEQQQAELQRFVSDCSNSAIAEVPEKANEQHYEVPAEFFLQVLGPRLKYSCCYWPAGVETLAEAEEAALLETVKRAELQDGQRILELGCGWGSLSLFMAERFPNAQIVAVSNSTPQRLQIEEQARLRGLENLEVRTADMNHFDPQAQFDRVVSVEMFEHMRNHRELLRRIASWLCLGGKLFVHIFCHRSTPYLYEDQGPQDWMTRHFFSGGMMPSDHLLLHYQEHLHLQNQWRWNGKHYERTCNAWLRLQDQSRDQLLPLLAEVYGRDSARMWFQRWRIFFMACAELFAYREGNEWWIAHYLMEKPMH